MEMSLGHGELHVVQYSWSAESAKGGERKVIQNAEGLDVMPYSIDCF